MSLKFLCFLLLGCGITNVLAAPKRKVPCALDDLACTTLTVDTLYKSVMRGRPDLKVPGSDPLKLRVISGVFDDMNYNFTNAELHGMMNCHVKRHNINVLELSFSVLLLCPQLVFKSNYEISGRMNGIPIEGKGQSNIVHDKYNIGFKGKFVVIVDPNGRPHLHVTTFDIERLEVNGNIKSEFSNLYYGDFAKSEAMTKYLNDNWKSINFLNKSPTMHPFMKNMFKNVNVFLRVVPANELFFREE